MRSMTPALRQATALLQMSREELVELVRQELLSNPVAGDDPPPDGGGRHRATPAHVDRRHLGPELHRPAGSGRLTRRCRLLDETARMVLDDGIPVSVARPGIVERAPEG